MNIKKLNNKKISLKNVLILSSFLFVIFILILTNKSHAIYKLEQKFDLIESRVGTYSSGDYQIAVLVDGKEADSFPSYETNYKVESIDCTNGATATFDVENWRLSIGDVSSTNCKCTISFNSKLRNSITPIAMSKTELLTLNDDITTSKYEMMKSNLLNDTYPVGSVYMSSEEDTAEKVQEKLGGTWVKYSENTMLMGAGSSYEANSTGGASSVKITNENLPAHNHPIPSLGGSASGGNHRHYLTGYTWAWGSNVAGTVFAPSSATAGTTKLNYIYTKQNVWNFSDYSGNLSLSVSTYASNTSGCTNCSNTAVNILNPYTAVYMYKRTA